MRARYGVDPEALGLAGPNAFADAFDASLRGMQLGENMATNALNRELAREQAEQVRRDRAIQATADTPVGFPSVATGGTGSGPGKKKSSKTETTSGFVPQSFSAFVRGQFEDEAEIRKLNETLADYDEARAKAGAGPSDSPYLITPASAQMVRQPRESGGFDVAAGLENPLTRINYRSDFLLTPRQAATLIRERAGEFNLDRAGVARLVQDYENFYAQRAGQYQDTMSAMMQAQADAAAEAAAERARLIQRGAVVANAMRFGGYQPTTEDMDALAAFNVADREAYGVPTGQMTDIRESRISSAAAQMNAALSRAKFNEQQRALRGAQNVRYQEAYVDAQREWLKANNVTDVSTLSPDAAADMEAYADQIGKREAAKVVNIPTAKEMFTGGADSGGPEPMTFEQARAAIALRADQKGYTYSKEGLDFAADQALKDPKAIASLRRGLADPATQRQVQPWEVHLQGGGGRIVQPPREPTEAQINAAKEAVEETGEVFDRDAYIDSYRRMTGSPGASG